MERLGGKQASPLEVLHLSEARRRVLPISNQCRSSFPCFFFRKRQGKPRKKQGFSVSSELLKSLEKKGKTLKKARNSSKSQKARKSRKQGKEDQGSADGATRSKMAPPTATPAQTTASRVLTTVCKLGCPVLTLLACPWGLESQTTKHPLLPPLTLARNCRQESRISPCTTRNSDLSGTKTLRFIKR